MKLIIVGFGVHAQVFPVCLGFSLFHEVVIRLFEKSESVFIK